jgi:uncharacterized protein
MREKFLRTIGKIAAEHTWKLSGLIFMLTIFFGAMAGQLKMDMNLTGLLPQDDPMVDEFNKIYHHFDGANTAFVVVKGETEKMIAYAERISPMIMELESWIEKNGSQKVKDAHKKLQSAIPQDEKKNYYKRVDYKQPLDFINNHGLMLVPESELQNIEELFYDPNLLPFLFNLNNSLEKEYIKSETKLSTMQKERNAVNFLDGIESFTELLQQGLVSERDLEENGIAAADALTLGSPYLMSPDRSMLLIMATPNFNIMNVDYYTPAINGLEEMVKEIAEKMDVEAGLTGSIVLGRDEMVAGTEDSMTLTLLALLAVLIMFVITFRMVSAPLLAIFNLLIGVTWAMGVTWFLVDTLNMFTAMMAVILVGLGIDFSIHIISVYTELSLKGESPHDAIIHTLEKVGTGIITGAITTAMAFLTLVIARSAGIKEFGLVNGVGLIVIMMATLLTMPTLLMLREKYRLWRGKEHTVYRDLSFQSVGALSLWIHSHRKLSFFFIFVVTLGLGIFIPRLTMDYNYLNMEPEGLESILLNEEIIEKFNMSSDMTMMTASSLAENAALTEEAKKKASISFVESITDYIPHEEKQQQRQEKLGYLQEKISAASTGAKLRPEEKERLFEELLRLEANIIELQDMAFLGGQDMVDEKASRLVGNPDQPELIGKLSALISDLEADFPLKKINTFNSSFSRQYRNNVLKMANPELITLEMLPDILHDKYISEDGRTFLITIYPKGNVWHIDYLESFTNDVLDISRSIVGTPPMFYFLLKIIGEDGKRALFFTVFVVFLMLLIDFRSLRFALLSMLPLLFGLIWMTGFMALTGIQLTLLNIIALPLIVGIGIDDGVHIIHRYRVEGEAAIGTVFASTGKAVIITSFTTMLSFGSLVFATYRGFGSMGLALFIGVGMCLLASLIVLPALLKRV